MRSASPAAQRYSICTLRPTAQPHSCSPCRNALNAGLSFRIVRGQMHEHSNAPHPVSLLPARRERPRDRRPAEQRNEIAPVQSIEWHLLPQPDTS
jgi:hypothetical protein